MSATTRKSAKSGSSAKAAAAPAVPVCMLVPEPVWVAPEARYSDSIRPTVTGTPELKWVPPVASHIDSVPIKFA